jgi:hypothetical protein
MMLRQEILENIAMLRCNPNALPMHHQIAGGSATGRRSCLHAPGHKTQESRWAFETHTIRADDNSRVYGYYKTLADGNPVRIGGGSGQFQPDGAGRTEDVPDEAVVVGSYKNTAVWVLPCHLSDLDEFANLVELQLCLRPTETCDACGRGSQ